MQAHAAPTTLRVARFLRGERARRVGLLVVRLVQVVALVLALHVSGVAHHVADMLFQDAAGESSREDDDTDCPPGCPTCHSCAHAQAPYVPRAPKVGEAPMALVLARVTPARTPVNQNDRTQLFRPPRSPAASG